jgi:hypothetical protein
MVDLGPIWGVGPSVIRSIFVICPMIGIFLFAPGLVGTFQDSEVGPERHAPVPRLDLPMSRSVSEPLADYPAQGPVRAFQVINTECDPVAVPKIEFGEVTVKVFLADVLIDAVDPAFQDREISLGGVSMSVASDIFLLRVNDGLMAGEFLASFPVNAALVSSQVRGFVDPFLKNWPQVRRIHFRDMMGADAALALDQGDDCFLRCGSPIGAVSGSTADESLISLDKLSFAAKRPGIVRPQIGHRLADTVRQEPCGLQSDAEDAVQLVAAHALLAGTEQVHRLQPDMQLHMAGLEHGADLHSKGLPAGVALVDADPGAVALQGSTFIDHSAVRAWPTVGPKSRLDEPIGGFFTVEMCGGKDGRHGVSP